MLSVNRPNGAEWGQATDLSHAHSFPAAAASASSATAAMAAAHSLTESEAVAANVLADFGGDPEGFVNLPTDPESLVAAYLSRQEAGPAREDDVAMQTDAPAMAQPETRPESIALPVAVAKPKTADASTQTVAPRSAAAILPIGLHASMSPIRQTVDTCSDAIRLIENDACLPPGSSVAIRVANDQGLALLANAIKSAPHSCLGLRLDRQGYTFTAKGLKQLAPLPLNSLTIMNAGFFPEDFKALANASYAISLGLAKPKSFTQIIPGYGPNTVVERTPYFQSAISLPTLQILSISDTEVSDAEMAAIQVHPSLKSLTVQAPVPKLFRSILANPRIEKLTLNGSELRGASFLDQHVFQGLSTHPALRSLSVNHVDIRQLMRELEFNKTIVRLQLRMTPIAVCAARFLANMPALRELVLQASEPNAALDRADIDALCKKPLQALQLRGFKMNESTVSTAVRAQAKNLLVSAENIRFSSADIDALCANKAVSRLSLGGHILPADAARLAASPTLSELILEQVPSEIANAVNASAQRGWVATGKPLSSLRAGPIDTNYMTTWMIA